MRKLVRFGLVLAVALGLGAFALVNAAGEAKYSIKDVMKEAMKGGLCKKVASGKGDAADKAKLLEMSESLAAQKPPKGSEAAWKEKTTALIEACKKGDGAALGKAANCTACHNDHR